VQAFDLESVAQQVTDVKSYVASLPVNAGVRNAMTVKLTQAMALFQSVRPADAENMVSGLVSQVQGLADAGTLDADQTDFLLGSAEAIDSHITE